MCVFYGKKPLRNEYANFKSTKTWNSVESYDEGSLFYESFGFPISSSYLWCDPIYQLQWNYPFGFEIANLSFSLPVFLGRKWLFSRRLGWKMRHCQFRFWVRLGFAAFFGPESASHQFGRGARWKRFQPKASDRYFLTSLSRSGFNLPICADLK